MSEEKHHHHFFHHKDEEKPVDAVAYSETTYATDGYTGYGETTQVLADDVPAPDYHKEEKHHKHHEHLGELGAAAAGAYALVILIYKFYAPNPNYSFNYFIFHYNFYFVHN